MKSKAQIESNTDKHTVQNIQHGSLITSYQETYQLGTQGKVDI